MIKNNNNNDYSNVVISTIFTVWYCIGLRLVIGKVPGKKERGEGAQSNLQPDEG